MYGHHVSKAAANMSAKMLSLDLADEGVTVVAIHVSICRFHSGLKTSSCACHAPPSDQNESN